MQATLLIATIAQHWWLHLIPSQPVEVQPAITVRPKYGMRMRLERQDAFLAPLDHRSHS